MVDGGALLLRRDHRGAVLEVRVARQRIAALLRVEDAVEDGERGREQIDAAHGRAIEGAGREREQLAALVVPEHSADAGTERRGVCREAFTLDALAALSREA